MAECPSCSSEVPEGSRFCGACGCALANGGEPATETAAGASSPPSSSSLDEARFLPGTILAERYRVVGLLGKGGMGEVYRADDLKLGQPVALKFLPEELAQDPHRLERFRNEVRVARHISHPNVCRVYDIGEADGQSFISMEYVDGEDLRSLLHRIGRLPREKSIQIARQLCAGLAAAHETGVLHRDLKPANVMIDGRGKVRIMDFGLAGLKEGFEGAELRAGTPAYMAPEQLLGEGISERSDLYSLGLVLYEVLTGERAFRGETAAELTRERQESIPPNPSSIVEELDPVVERVVLHCLESDPRNRPSSALAVSAGLPGGDPLAEALAAGETPSPELVAAAGEEGSLRSAIATPMLAVALLAILVVVFLADRTRLTGHVPLERPPEVLEERARELLAAAGYEEEPADTARGFFADLSGLMYLAGEDDSADRWSRLKTGRPAVVSYWYRQSPAHLVPENRLSVVTRNDPPPLRPGMALVQLDTLGRLVRLSVVPDAGAEAGEGEPAWDALFAAAGLDPEAFIQVPPKRLPASYGEGRIAWQGPDPDAEGEYLRIEAASFRGRPTWFELHGAWRGDGPVEALQGWRAMLAQTIVIALVIVSLLIGVLLARRNLRTGRGDRRGAYRVALYVFCILFVVWLVQGSHVPNPVDMWTMFQNSIGTALFWGAFLWVLYSALEPYVRRRWPERIISWRRLLEGRFRDPLVGRDVLIGVLLGAGLSVLTSLWFLASGWIGRPPSAPNPVLFETLLDARSGVSAVLMMQLSAIANAMFFLFVLLMLNVILRNRWLAMVVFVLFMMPIAMAGSLDPKGQLLLGLIVLVVIVGVLMRFGLLSLMALLWARSLLEIFPITHHLTEWRGGAALIALAFLLALLLYSYFVSLGGRPLFSGTLFQD